MSEILRKFKVVLNDPSKAVRAVLYRIGIRIQTNKYISMLCKGHCVEVGALSSPAILPNAKSIRYADVGDKEKTKASLEKIGYFGYHKNKQDFVDVDFIFESDSPPLHSLEASSIDCVFSSHSLEHSSNPIAALIDYLRVVKCGGIVYTIIPNKKHTYDNKRTTTSVDKLVTKYLANDWSYTLSEYRDVFVNTDTHDVYDNSTEEDIVKAFNDNDGMHHIYVYDEVNTLALIDYVLKNVSAELVYFDSTNQWDIHFALRKV
jgi:hypothetical protein